MKAYREAYAEKAAWRLEKGYAPLAADAVIGRNYRRLAKNPWTLTGLLAGELVASEEEWQKEAAKKAAQQARTS